MYLVEPGIDEGDIGTARQGIGIIDQDRVVVRKPSLAEQLFKGRVAGKFIANAISLRNVQRLPGQIDRTRDMAL